VPTQKLSSVDAFVVIDLDDAPVSTGIVRCAPKLLPSGAADLARSLTYSYASLGMQRSGASAGINAPVPERGAAINAFVAEVAPMVERQAFLPDAGKGVNAAELESLLAHDPRRPLSAEEHDTLVAAGAIAAAELVAGSLDGRHVVIEGLGRNSAPLVARLLEKGAKVVAASTTKGSVADPQGLSALDLAKGESIAGDGAEPAYKALGVPCDVIFTGSKIGAIDHKGAGFVDAKVVVPTAPIPVTAKALATLRRSGAAVLPDFVTLAGPLLAAWGDPSRSIADAEKDAAAAVQAILAEVLPHADGPLLGACERAEAFLRTWRPSLPFGRPLAA
jgi:hypothetical protein